MPPTDAQGDTPHCPDCDYDLSGLDLPSPCPECGRAATDASVNRVRPWPATPDILKRLLWPGALAPLLVLAWLIERPLGAVASAGLLICFMLVSVTVAGSVSVECCVPRKRDGVFLRVLFVGLIVNGSAWLVCSIFGYLLVS
jgi:hypothetical protein